MLQVFSIYMHLHYTAVHCVGSPADKGQHTAKLQELIAAAEAVPEAQLLQMGLPVLR